MYYPDDIKALRLRLGLTPTQFAARLNVSASTICLWEKGDRRPRFDAMVALNELDNGKRELVGAK